MAGESGEVLDSHDEPARAQKKCFRLNLMVMQRTALAFDYFENLAAVLCAVRDPDLASQALGNYMNRLPYSIHLCVPFRSPLDSYPDRQRRAALSTYPMPVPHLEIVEVP